MLTPCCNMLSPIPDGTISQEVKQGPVVNCWVTQEKQSTACSTNPSRRVKASVAYVLTTNRVLGSFQHPAQPHNAFDEDVWVAASIPVLPASAIWVLGKVDSTTSKAVSSTPESFLFDSVGSIFTGCMVQLQSHPCKVKLSKVPNLSHNDCIVTFCKCLHTSCCAQIREFSSITYMA